MAVDSSEKNGISFRWSDRITSSCYFPTLAKTRWIALDDFELWHDVMEDGRAVSDRLV